MLDSPTRHGSNRCTIAGRQGKVGNGKENDIGVGVGDLSSCHCTDAELVPLSIN